MSLYLLDQKEMEPHPQQIRYSEYDVGDVLLIRPTSEEATESGQRFWVGEVADLADEAHGNASIRWYRSDIFSF